jgi:hypothetical protein
MEIRLNCTKRRRSRQKIGHSTRVFEAPGVGNWRSAHPAIPLRSGELGGDPPQGAYPDFGLFKTPSFRAAVVEAQDAAAIHGQIADEDAKY